VSLLAAASLGIVAVVLAAVAYEEALRSLPQRLRRPRRPARERAHLGDPGRELRAERRAEALLRSVLGEEGWQTYRALGLIAAYGPRRGDGRPDYGYLIYPHRPIVSFDARTGELLSELCVTFPDRSDPRVGERLPDADDVLAKWMALRGDERKLLARANMHVVGRQVDPAQARRDIARLGEFAAAGDTSVAA
jgi:hypothetical protein